MKTDAERWGDLLAAAATARVRVTKLGAELGSHRELVRHIDIALRLLAPTNDRPLEDVKAIATAISELVRIAEPAGVDEETIDDADRARRRLVRAADAFLVDTQVIT